MSCARKTGAWESWHVERSRARNLVCRIVVLKGGTIWWQGQAYQSNTKNVRGWLLHIEWTHHSSHNNILSKAMAHSGPPLKSPEYCATFVIFKGGSVSAGQEASHPPSPLAASQHPRRTQRGSCRSALKLNEQFWRLLRGCMWQAGRAHPTSAGTPTQSLWPSGPKL